MPLKHLGLVGDGITHSIFLEWDAGLEYEPRMVLYIYMNTHVFYRLDISDRLRPVTL